MIYSTEGQRPTNIYGMAILKTHYQNYIGMGKTCEPAIGCILCKTTSTSSHLHRRLFAGEPHFCSSALWCCLVWRRWWRFVVHLQLSTAQLQLQLRFLSCTKCLWWRPQLYTQHRCSRSVMERRRWPATALGLEVVVEVITCPPTLATFISCHAGSG